MPGAISSIIGILPSAAGPDAGSATQISGRPRDLESAAQQFEALMMHQMLQSARGTGGSWFGTGEDDEDQASAQAMELAQEQFAGALAAKGGLGLAKLIVSRLVPGTESGAPASSQQSIASGSVRDSGHETAPATNQ